MPQFTLSGAVANTCMCTHTDKDHDEKEGCTRQVEGYDGMGVCPCPRYKEAEDR